MRACAPSTYDYELGLDGAQGAVILDAHVRSTGRRDCRVFDQVIVRMTDLQGHVLPIRNNPIRAVVAAAIRPDAVEQTHPALIAWRNWCAKHPTAFAYTVESTTKHARFRWRDFPVPTCTDPAQPPYLRLFTDRG
jgi:hypothetical protein